MKTAFIHLFLVFLAPVLFAQDPGKLSIGELTVKLIFASNGDVKAAGDLAKELPADEIKELQKIDELKFKAYRLLGSDSPDILKGYENWATPLRPSKEILVSFQPLERIGHDKIQMVMEYWQGKQKILSTNPTLTKGKTLNLLGPEWRKGRLILSLKISRLEKP